MKLNLEGLWQSLSTCRRLDIAIGMLGPWLCSSVPGEVELLLDACPKKLRGHLALLLGDLLSGWPRAIVGVPVLLWCAHSEDPEPELRRVVLPVAAGVEPPCPELRFLGWLAIDALLPAPGAQAGRLAEVEVGVCGAAVAIFGVQPSADANELSGTEIRPLWWGELMAGMPGSVYISVGVVQSYPVALEVARAMSLAAGGAGSGAAAAQVFATPLELSAGIEAGMLFKGRAEAALQGSGSWTKGGDDELI